MNFSIVKDDSDKKSNSFLTSRSEESLINHTIINLLLWFFVGSLLDTNLASHLCEGGILTLCKARVFIQVFSPYTLLYLA